MHDTDAGREMTTILDLGAFLVRCYARESANEPPHVHVVVDREHVVRINLLDYTWMDAPPRRAVQAMHLYRTHKPACLEAWNRLHSDRIL
jgi:hypothetical protein